ncbi:MAG TPA: GldG family protein [Pyrinomonadaceae bacterium]|nr:GldG family protein [Pyrinomonadaceae bacterium]
MNLELLKARQTKFAGYIGIYVVIILVAIVVLNVLANRYNKSYDGTANKRYSLSDQTKKIVKDLNQDATIRYFDQSTRYAQAKDLLDQYAGLSSKVHVEYVDPDKNPEVARAAGIKEPGTAVVQIGERKEEAKSMTEEGLTGAFIRTLKNKSRTVCFLSGSGEHQIDDMDRSGFSRFKELLGKDEYEAKSINLLQKAEIPADCTAIVVAGPTADYQQPAVDAIKKYVEEGGRALFMLDPPFKLGKSDIADNEPLTKLLATWGVTMNKDLVLDLNPVGQLAGLGPQVALVTKYENHPIVNPMKGNVTGFPLSRSMEIKNADKTTVEKLLSSSDSSQATSNLSSPEIDPNDPKNKKGPLTIGAAGSYNTGKENSEGRFVVIGGSSWAANSFINFNGNPDLALNAMNWLSSDEDLISIRPKAEDDRRITMTQSQFSWVRATSQFFVPLLVLVLGVSVWWRRR